MKTMTCRQLGGVCDKEFRANSFAEIADLSKQHGMEMFLKRDAPHLEVISKMQELMTDRDAMKEWFESKKREFEALPESE